MKSRFFRNLTFVTIFVSGLGLGWAVSAGAQAQRRPVSTSLATAQSPATSTTMNGRSVITGSDVGVRIDSQAGGHVNGTLVVKVAGTWKEVQLAGQR